MPDRERQAELIEAAVAYVGRGLPVFPCKGKLPLTQHGFQDASTDTEAVLAWWTRWPTANIGMPTGAASGVDVLDVDTPKGGAGTLAELERTHGKLAETIVVLTPSGGRHYWFTHNGRLLKSSAGQLGPGLDTRGDGGYVVVPPSVGDNGRAYSFMRPPEKVQTAGPPAWLFELLDETKRSNGTGAKVAEVIPEGQRRAAMLSVAGKLKRAGLTGEEILPTLRELNKRCQPPLDEAELESVALKTTRIEPEQLGRPVYTGPPSPLADTVGVFTRWLHLPDVEPVYAALGAAAANYLPGAPVWLVIVGPPASGKTEILSALSRLPDVYHAATLTEASLLSGSPQREHSSSAKGGLLREVGDFGLVILKDMGSILSMRPDAKAEILAALREVFDGSWTRYVGTDGGKTLAWTGKLGLLAGATPIIDRHHGVLAAMGERFTLCRLAEADSEQAIRALSHTGEREGLMRQELAEAVAALFAGRKANPREPVDDEKNELVRLASLVTRARSAVERDRHTREIELVPGAEGPARLAVTLERLLAGLDVLGCERELSWTVVRRVAIDCIPALRRQLLEHLCDGGAPEPTKDIAEAVSLPTNTVRRALEDLTAYGLMTRYSQGPGKADVWQASQWARERMR